MTTYAVLVPCDYHPTGWRVIDIPFPTLDAARKWVADHRGMNAPHREYRVVRCDVLEVVRGV